MKDKLGFRVVIGGALGLLALLLTAAVTDAFWPQLFDAFEAKTLDWRYIGRLEKLWNERHGAPIEDIIIIDIDNRSLDKLGRFDQWPRNYHAQVIDYITEGGALAVGFDVLFMEPDKNPEMDQALITSTTQSDIVYHAMAFSQADPGSFLYEMKQAPDGFDTESFSFALPQSAVSGFKIAHRMDGKIIDLYNSAAGIGFANFSPDNDGVVRTMPMFLNFAGRQYPALSLAIVLGVLELSEEDIEIIPGKAITLRPPEPAEGETLSIPIDEQGRLPINYVGTFRTFRYISYYDVLMQRIPVETFEGRIVLIGTSAAGLTDLRPVPFQDAFPGVEIHANIIYNILTQEFISYPTTLISFLLLLALTLAIAILVLVLRPWLSAIFWLLIAGGYSYLGVSLFTHHALWVELVRPMSAMFLAMLLVFIYRYTEEERKKKQIQGMFQHYLSASVVQELLKNPKLLNLGGERRIATAFFSDIKSFTTVSESLSPEELVAQLNEYLSAMSEIVLKYEGYIDKYEGDAIMAVFGVPLDQTDHAKRACLAALEMQKEMRNLRKKWHLQERPEFYMRIGINSGPMIAGNIGGKHRFDYTVIGDAVNLASRLEGANKTYGTDIMVSEYTNKLLSDEMVTRELDFLRVKGKTEPVRVYELVAKSHTQLDEEKLVILDLFSKGLQEYRNYNWEAALAAFNRILGLDPNDGPAKTYTERCEFYRNNLVPEDWNGVFEMRIK